MTHDMEKLRAMAAEALDGEEPAKTYDEAAILSWALDVLTGRCCGACGASRCECEEER